MDIISSNSWRSERLGRIKTTLFGMLQVYLNPESLMFYLFFFVSVDNPLICDCDLRWYRDWLKELRHRDDDDIIQKKHILCLMEEEHRCVLFRKFYKIIIICISTRKIGGCGSSGEGIVFADGCTR